MHVCVCMFITYRLGRGSKMEDGPLTSLSHTLVSAHP